MNRVAPIPPSGNKDDSLRNYLVEEYVEEYQEGRMSRRDVLKRLGGLLGSAALASTFLAACAPPAPASAPPTAAPATVAPTTAVTTAPAATIAPTAAATQASAALNVAADDPAIEAMAVTFPGQGATIMGYLAKPKGNGPFPIVLVCHENRGLLDHIKDVARRYGKAGYVALAVDLLSRQGGTDKVAADQVPGMLGNMDPTQMVNDFKSGLAYAQTLAYARKDRAGMVGFCFGGGIAWRSAMAIPELRAAVPYYGPNPPSLDDVPKINAAILAFYGELDTRVDAGIPAMEDALKKSNKTFEKVIYPNANHAFNNDTGASYNAAAARDAFAKSVAWFDKYLKS
jgi:carboxymethylenebutenolidase